MPQPTTLVLLPGLDGTGVMFRPLIECLPDWIRPRVVPLPNEGPNDYDSLLPVVDDACADLDHYDLLGWSFSGPLAVLAAARNPPALRRLVLCATFLRTPRPSLRWTRPFIVAPLGRLLAPASKLGAWLGAYESPAFRGLVRETLRATTPRALAARGRAALDVDVRDRIVACRQPVLDLRSSRDRVVPGTHAVELKQLRPDAMQATIDGPHVALALDGARSGAAIIAEFLAKD